MEPANILKFESLSDDWCDKDVVILHAGFQLLKDFLEKEKNWLLYTDWTYDEEVKTAKAEIDFLYSWWLERVDKLDDLNGIQYEEDNQMLKRLIDVRKYLWT